MASEYQYLSTNGVAFEREGQMHFVRRWELGLYDTTLFQLKNGLEGLAVLTYVDARLEDVKVAAEAWLNEHNIPVAQSEVDCWLSSELEGYHDEYYVDRKIIVEVRGSRALNSQELQQKQETRKKKRKGAQERRLKEKQKKEAEDLANLQKLAAKYPNELKKLLASEDS